MHKFIHHFNSFPALQKDLQYEYKTVAESKTCKPLKNTSSACKTRLDKEAMVRKKKLDIMLSQDTCSGWSTVGKTKRFKFVEYLVKPALVFNQKPLQSTNKQFRWSTIQKIKYNGTSSSNYMYRDVGQEGKMVLYGQEEKMVRSFFLPDQHLSRHVTSCASPVICNHINLVFHNMYLYLWH